MNKRDKIWIKSMDWCSKYWGCHQLPERSFFIGKYQFPICARCTGIILGYIISFIYSILYAKLNIVFAICFLIPMAFDGLLQFLTDYISNNAKRFITGILGGFGVIQIVKNIMLFIIE